MLRMYGELLPIKFRDLRDTELEGYISEIIPHSQAARFSQGHDADFSYVSADGGRFRVNVFRKDTGVGAVFRTIPSEIPTLDKLGLPPVVRKLCDYHQGMILVTGATGSGKSTTLAAMIDLLNETRRLNIISLEDPIEFVHRSKSSQVIQQLGAPAERRRLRAACEDLT
jgi:twitching motility protein PilT